MPIQHNDWISDPFSVHSTLWSAWTLHCLQQFWIEHFDRSHAEWNHFQCRFSRISLQIPCPNEFVEWFFRIFQPYKQSAHRCYQLLSQHFPYSIQSNGLNQRLWTVLINKLCWAQQTLRLWFCPCLEFGLMPLERADTNWWLHSDDGFILYER